MKLVSAALVVIGLVGMILCVCMPAFFGYSGIIASVTAIVVGIGFLLYFCRCFHRDC